MKHLYQQEKDFACAPLNEMAQVNKREQNIFPFNAYKVFVLSEERNKFAHFHIKSLQDGWEIRVLLNGKIHSIKTKSSKRTKIEDFADIQKKIYKWFKLDSKIAKCCSNEEAVRIFWDAEN